MSMIRGTKIFSCPLLWVHYKVLIQVRSLSINDKEKEYREAHENEELISYGEDGSVHDAWEEEKEKLIQQLVTEQQMEIIKEEK